MRATRLFILIIAEKMRKNTASGEAFVVYHHTVKDFNNFTLSLCYFGHLVLHETQSLATARFKRKKITYPSP
jgi:hypothetical protein